MAADSKSSKGRFGAVLALALAFALLALGLVGCAPEEEPAGTDGEGESDAVATSSVQPFAGDGNIVPASRSYITISLGEELSSKLRFFPTSRAGRLVAGLTSVRLSDIATIKADGVNYDENGNVCVCITISPIKSQFGFTITAEDIEGSIRAAYQEDVNRFDANLLRVKSNGLDLNLVFDREADFAGLFNELRIYPSTRISGKDFDSFGDYFISDDSAIDIQLDLFSNTLKENRKLHFINLPFEQARKEYEEGRIDILYLPKREAAAYWAEAQVEGVVHHIMADYVYMLGFGPLVSYQDRAEVFRAVSQKNFISECLGGSADVTNYPLSKPIFVSDEIYQIPSDEGQVLRYICFLNAQWSYDFSNYFKHAMEARGFEVDVIYTDFLSMITMGSSQDSEYIYAFAWDLGRGTDLGRLIGPELSEYGRNTVSPAFDNSGNVKSWETLDEEGSDAFMLSLPVLPLARPYDSYIVRDRALVELLGNQ